MIELGIHSPITRIAGFEWEERGISLWMKRDDMIHPFISGNKWRKLKYALREAGARGCDRLVTFGGAWSNHLLATACAGATFGFKTLGFVRGDEKVSNPVLSLCSLFGMELRYVDRERYRDKAALFRFFFPTETERAQVYFIDEGGFGPHAMSGCSEIISELLMPVDGAARSEAHGEAPPRVYEHIFCACGTGATLAGLAKGLEENARVDIGWQKHGGKRSPTKLHGVPVLKNADFVADQVRELYPPANFEWHNAYHFGGYAKSTPALDHFIRDFCSRTGILIEPVYTGKLCYAVFDLIKQGKFRHGDRILILHSGGLTGLLGMHQRFAFFPNNQ